MYVEESYMGKGIVYIDGLDGGNIKGLKFTFSEEEKSQFNYRTSGGGKLNSVTRLSEAKVEIVFGDYSTDAFEKAIRAVSTSTTAGTVSGESVTAPASLTGDRLARTAKVLDTSQAVTVTSDPVGTSYTEGTDYDIAPGGIIILESGSITANDPLLVSYTNLASTTTEALTASSPEYKIVFDGVNEAQNNKPVIVTAHRVKFGLASELSFIADDYGDITLSADMLADTTITGTNKSQHFVVEKAA